MARPFFFFLNDTAPTEIYLLPLHDALPFSPPLVRPPGAAASAPRTAASTTRVASASGFASVHPAAFGWPPPPNCAAIRCTSTSPLPRRLTFTWPRYSRKRHATRTVATERG